MVETRIGATGGNGFVGSAILDEGTLRPTSSEVNILDIDQVRRFIKENNIRVMVHAGAYTNVPKAKSEYEKVKEINGTGTKHVAIACKENGAKMVLLSSDFIFPGNARNPGLYAEDARRPESFTSIALGAYGSSKLLSEIMAQNNCPNLAIIRCSYPFGGQNPDKDYMLKLINRVKSGGAVFSDQTITPTYLPDLKVGLKVIIDNDLTGIFHIVTTRTTPYEMARYVIARLGLPYKVKEGSCTDYLQNPNVDQIPQLGGLDCTQTQERTNVDFHQVNDAIDETLSYY
jgi:dTDP-4-dehydrorhamnose reductase